MDALAGASLGYPGIATLGVAPTRATVAHIAALVHSYPRTILLPDHDSVGKWVTLQGMLAQHGVYARIVELTSYKDLAEVPAQEREGFLGSI
jgi:DNA primase